MNKRETVQALMDSVQQGEFENINSMLADDFRFSDSVSEPINTVFSVRREKTKLTVNGDQIMAWVVEPTEGAGLKAILGQLQSKPDIL